MKSGNIDLSVLANETYRLYNENNLVGGDPSKVAQLKNII